MLENIAQILGIKRFDGRIQAVTHWAGDLLACVELTGLTRIETSLLTATYRADLIRREKDGLIRAVFKAQ